MPYFDFVCSSDKCDEKIELNVRSNETPEISCQKCGAALKKLPGLGGYKTIANNGASQRPKNAGSFRGGK